MPGAPMRSTVLAPLGPQHPHTGHHRPQAPPAPQIYKDSETRDEGSTLALEPHISHQCNPRLDCNSCSDELKEQKTHAFPLSETGVSVPDSPGRVLAGG